MKKVSKEVKELARKYKVRTTYDKKVNGVSKRYPRNETAIKNEIKKKKSRKTKKSKSKTTKFGNRRPLLIAPFGPGNPQNWFAPDDKPAYSEAPLASFGKLRASQNVTPAGYLAFQNAQPVSVPPLWNPLLRQGGNQFSSDMVFPKLGNVRR